MGSAGAARGRADDEDEGAQMEARASVGPGDEDGRRGRIVGDSGRRDGVLAIGALAIGALTIGALAIGALAIGRLAVGRATIRRLRVGRLEVDGLIVRSLTRPSGR